MTTEAAAVALVAFAVEVLKLAVVVGGILFLLYWLVRFVKWSWTDTPQPLRTQTEATDAEKGDAKAMALLETGAPLSKEQWETVLDASSGHTTDGYPICQKCGFAISDGRAVLLTNDETKALASTKPGGRLHGAFRHTSEAECRAAIRA